MLISNRDLIPYGCATKGQGLHVPFGSYGPAVSSSLVTHVPNVTCLEQDATAANPQ
jgi:hypothetical protein